MNDPTAQVLQRFGGKAIIAIVVAGLVIWALAHWNAAPGRSVSILWGLVEYTKPSPPTAGRQEFLPTPKVSSLSESDEITSIEGPRQGRVEVIAHDYSKASWSAGRAELRKLRGLRELSTLESGKLLGSMPGGTFGFVNFLMAMIDRSGLSSALSKLTVGRFDSKDSSYPIFEIHCDRQTDRFLLGFTTETTATGLTSSSGIKEVVLAARPQVDLTSLVLIDMRMLGSMGLRLLEADSGESDWVLDIALW